MERVKFTQEFLFKASPAIVYKFFTTPSCLVRWFCDQVDIQGDSFTFYWQGAAEEAELVDDIEEERLRFHWLDADDDTEYLEFEISKSPVTGDTILLITDFCDEDEVDDQKQLWRSQMDELRKEMGG
ncbi:START-like domain-containing protein [Phaeodactylibacter luteus]|uniref:SRPBCC domain-containing protein n=1 Tax=Phaeodactylibacter luteus TaxID=1564516 RepID=A0A5C6RMC8_9BACT|nr:START-like domain-containing protein [Phaeodactylibacter luteus]TXB63115.1 SRPBCC domain-containing protein [Phaeodactylibacter luteus]